MKRTVLAIADLVYDAIIDIGSRPVNAVIVCTGDEYLYLVTGHCHNACDSTTGTLSIRNGLATFEPDNADPLGFEMVRIVGSDTIRFLTHSDQSINPMFDRQVRLLGSDGQSILNRLHVGVIGASGTGSPTFEQLVRIGVGTITVIDPKQVTDTNITRIYGSTLDDIGSPKVDVLAQHAKRIGLNTNVIAINGTVTSCEVAQQLKHCDVLFCCTDDHAGRNIASRLAYRYLIPLFNAGVEARTPGDQIAGVYGRITVSGPGLACLSCLGQTLPRRAYADALDPDARQRLAHEGYAPALGQPDPSVISDTTATSGLLVSAFVNRLIGFDHPASHQLVVFDRYKSFPEPADQVDGHYCNDPRYVGAGDCDPFLDTTWTS